MIYADAKWICPTCDVPNKSDATACVCCATKNPKTPAQKTTETSTYNPNNSSTQTQTSQFKFGVVNGNGGSSTVKCK
jgi:hypothetical protein